MRPWFGGSGKMQKSTLSKWVKCSSIAARGALIMAAAWASFGCDSGSFIPPVNPELRGDGGSAPIAVTDSTLARASSEVAPEPGRPIELILAAHDPDEVEGWKSSARMQAGLDKVKLKISVLAAESPKAKQAELIQEALIHRPRGLVVEPADPADPHLAQAIEAARNQGVPVVLVGRPLAGGKTPSASAESPAAKSGAPRQERAPLVVLEPNFTESAVQMVAAVIRVVQAAELDPAGGAVVVINTNSDPFMSPRARAIVEALKAAKISVVDQVRFATDPKIGEQVLKDYFKAHPKIVMVIGVDPTSAASVREVVSAEGSGRLFIAACYTTEDQFSNVSRMPNFAAVADFTPTRLLRKAILIAVALAQGKESPPVVEYRAKVSELTADTNALRSHFLAPSKATARPSPRDPG
jgi:ABC-type sugar transport system substrate-binding protein